MSPKSIDYKGHTPHFYFNENIFTCSSLFDYERTSDYILVFNSVNSENLTQLKQYLNENKNQKLLFVAHILFDYQKAIDSLLQVLDPDRVLVLVENHKHPFIVSENDIKELKLKDLKLENILVYNKKSIKKKTKVQIPFVVLLRYLLFFVIHILLKPKQFVNDFFATYNARYFYGQTKIIFVKLYFSIRHLSVMSMIRFFYGLKAILIRFFYWIIEKIKMLSLGGFYRIRHFTLMIPIYLQRFYYWIVEKVKTWTLAFFYGLRHLAVMSFIRFFYGIKVLCIRLYYWTSNYFKRIILWIYFKARHLIVISFLRIYYSFHSSLGYLKIFYIKLYFSVRHIVVMGLIRLTVFFKIIGVFFYYRFLAISNYSRGALIWFYYRIMDLFNHSRNLFIRIYYFNLRYTFYPFRKIYWFLRFQYYKRILKRKV